MDMLKKLLPWVGRSPWLLGLFLIAFAVSQPDICAAQTTDDILQAAAASTADQLVASGGRKLQANDLDGAGVARLWRAGRDVEGWLEQDPGPVFGGRD